MESDTCNIVSYKYYKANKYQNGTLKYDTIWTPDYYKSFNYNGGYNKLGINVANGPISFAWTAVFSDGSEKQVDYEGNKEFVAKDPDDCDNYITWGSLESTYFAFVGQTFPTIDITATSNNSNCVINPESFRIYPYSSSDSNSAVSMTPSGSIAVETKNAMESTRFYFRFTAGEQE